MKKLLLIALLFSGTTLLAQNADFGIKGGLNFGATGDYENYSQVIGDASTVIEGKEKAGYHLGAFAKFEILGFFLQPELMYTRLNTEYDTFDYKVNKIDAPILVGVNVLGPLNIKAGPSFQYILNNEIDNSVITISEADDKITLGFQLGAGIEIGKLGLDARYEGAFKENNAYSDAAADYNFKIDSRPSQWILSVSYKL